MAGFSNATYKFLKAIDRNTAPPKSVAAAKRWFEENRSEYEESIKVPCQDFVADLKKRIGSLAVGYEFPRSSFGRLYRDPRKAHERGPFKNWTGASISPPSQSLYEHHPGLWFQIGAAPDDIFVSGGLYMPSSAQLRLMRAAFDSEWVTSWEKLLSSKSIVSRYDKDHGDSLKTFPRGFPKDHPQMKWLRMTQFYLWKPYTQTQTTRADFSAQVADDIKPILKFNALINEALQKNLAHQLSRPPVDVSDIAVPRRKFDF